MPNLSIIRTVISELPKAGPLVVVLPGGTTGIGSYIADSLARVYAKHGSQLRVYIVGRNVSRAEDVVSRSKTVAPGSDWRFIQASDLSLISEVDRACETIIKQETESPLHQTPSIDLLYMSFCVNILSKPKTTTEAIDSFMSCVYYARMRFIQQLMPLLTAGALPGHAVSIYAGGFEEANKKGEYPIGQPKEIGISSVRKHADFMTTFMFEEWSQKYAGQLSLTHIYPGLVEGPGFYNEANPTWFKLVWPVMKLAMSFYRTSPQDCGDVMVYLATAQFPAKDGKGERTELTNNLKVANSTSGGSGNGCYAVGQRADATTKPVMFEKIRTEQTSKEIWDHTFEILNRIEKENSGK